VVDAAQHAPQAQRQPQAALRQRHLIRAGDQQVTSQRPALNGPPEEAPAADVEAEHGDDRAHRQVRLTEAVQQPGQARHGLVLLGQAGEQEQVVLERREADSGPEADGGVGSGDERLRVQRVDQGHQRRLEPGLISQLG